MLLVYSIDSISTLSDLELLPEMYLSRKQKNTFFLTWCFSQYPTHLCHVNEGQLLRCGHDDCGCEGDCLAQGELDVTRARREVTDQVVKVT
jgi:hypothetical protein